MLEVADKRICFLDYNTTEFKSEFIPITVVGFPSPSFPI
jgi:hypothetical protein